MVQDIDKAMRWKVKNANRMSSSADVEDQPTSPGASDYSPGVSPQAMLPCASFIRRLIKTLPERLLVMTARV